MSTMWKKKKPAEPVKKKSNALYEDENDRILGYDIYRKDTGDGKSQYIDMSMEEFEIKEMGKKDPTPEGEARDLHEDKIFGNSYNQGDVQATRLPEIKVRRDFATGLDCYDAEGTHVRNEMTRRVMEAFKASSWAKVQIDGKKFSKQLIPYVFNDLYTALDDGYSSTTDRFIAITEFLEISYEKVYQAVPVKIKERLLQEIDEVNGNITGRRITRLF